jgi:hypothetical protein
LGGTYQLTQKDGIGKPMEEILEYKHTPQFARRVSREFFLRRLGGVFIVLLLAQLYLILVSEINKSFLWGLAISSATIGIIYALISENKAAEKAKLLSNPVVTVTLNDEGITTDKVGQISTLKWQSLRNVMKLKSAWVFIPHNENFYVAIPADVINNSAKAFVERKMVENRKLIQ